MIFTIKPQTFKSIRAAQDFLASQWKEAPSEAFFDILTTLERGLRELEFAIAEEVPLEKLEQILVQERRKIDAIKKYRTRTGCGLGPAKAAVDQYEIEFKNGMGDSYEEDERFHRDMY